MTLYEHRDPFQQFGQSECEHRFQQNVIRHIFCHFNQPSLCDQLKCRASELYDKPTVTFGLFEQAYPAFPLTLESKRIKWAHKLTAFDLLDARRMQKSRLVEDYQEQAELAAVDTRSGCFGLVFPVHGRGKFVIHNMDRDDRLHQSATCRLSLPLGNKRSRVYASIEPFDALLNHVGNDWIGPCQL